MITAAATIASEFNDFLKAGNIPVVHGRPLHPQTQGKTERYNRSLKNVVKLGNYYSPGELEGAVESFVAPYHHHRYHESIHKLTPAQVCFHQAARIPEERERTKLRTLNKGRESYQRAKAA